MAGLVEYASSDDENEISSQKSSPTARNTDNLANAKGKKSTLTYANHQHTAKDQEIEPKPPPAPVETKYSEAQLVASPRPQIRQSSPQPTIGAVPLGPSLPLPGPKLTEFVTEALPTDESRSSSPYSSTRAIIHDLTLPSIPNLIIPPSPPGSPPLGTNKKFQQFLDLKRKGTHFNTKLESSTALRNPSLTDKLLAFVDLNGAAQYETTLPLDLYNPCGFPEWSNRDRLRKSREALAKEREGEKVVSRGVHFVSSLNSSTSTSLGSGRGGLSRLDKKPSGWR